MSDRTQTLSAPGRVKEVTSTSNPAVKQIRALFQKKHRDRQNAFIAEGQKLIVDALDQGWVIRSLVQAKSAREASAGVAARVVAIGGDVLIVPEKLLGALTRRDNPQMVIGVFQQQTMSLQAVKPAVGDVWIALDRVRDPGNLGTIVRTADAVGAKGVILVGDCTDPFSPEAVRATMGSIFTLPIVRCSEDEFVNWSNLSPGYIVGTHLRGAVDFRTIDFADRATIVLMGNEQQGLTDKLAECCDALARIPQVGNADSLNLAVSAGLMLYEARRSELALIDGEG